MNKAAKMKILAAVLLVLLVMAKAINAGVNQIILADAIYAYQMECISEHKEIFVTYDDKKSYTETVLRWWDWTYTQILPHGRYRIIKPYIGQVSSSEFVGQYFEKG